MRKFIDCFTFYNELDILKFRLKELDDVTDNFVIVESNYTHAGKPKPLFFQDNKELFNDYNHKIVHIIVEDMPNNGNAWSNEKHQRICILRGLKTLSLDSNDLVSITDADEIPDSKTILDLKQKGLEFVAALKMDLYYYNLNSQILDKWTSAKIVPYKIFQRKSPQDIRETAGNIIDRGGWHFSYFGDPSFIENKLKNFAHQEYNRQRFTDTNIIAKRIESNEDIFGRSYVKLLHIEISENKYLPSNFLMLLR
jgi:hypothetical protein